MDKTTGQVMVVSKERSRAIMKDFERDKKMAGMMVEN